MHFITSDTHFGHRNIVAGISVWPDKERNCRPFATLAEHDEEMLTRFNELVAEDDTLYHLGDVAFSEAKLIEFLSRLRCKNVFLTFGNHDKAARANTHRFSKTSERMEFTYNGKHIVIGHYGMRVWNKSHRGAYHFYGHSHGNLPGIGRSMDVGIDVALREFGVMQPFALDEAIAMLDKITPHEVDHHKITT